MKDNFWLHRPFGIDDGELDGLTLQQAFVLGYELSRVDEAIELGEPCSMTVHASNRQRIHDYCEKLGVPFSVRRVAGDKSEGWMQFEIL
jgi:hypothetical protein